MKIKLLFAAGLLFVLSSAFTTNVHYPVNRRTADVFDVGIFTTGGQTYDAWGDGAGHISSVYIVNADGSDGAKTYSSSGTYTAAHFANITFKVTSTGSTQSFSGYCAF